MAYWLLKYVNISDEFTSIANTFSQFERSRDERIQNTSQHFVSILGTKLLKEEFQDWSIEVTSNPISSNISMARESDI